MQYLLCASATFWDVKLNKQSMVHVYKMEMVFQRYLLSHILILFKNKTDFCSVDRSAVNSDERTIYIILIPKSFYSKLYMLKVMCLD